MKEATAYMKHFFEPKQITRRGETYLNVYIMFETALYSWLELTKPEQKVWDTQALYAGWSGYNLYTHTFIRAIRKDKNER